MSDGSSLKTSPSLLGRLRETPDDQSAWGEFVGRYRPKIFRWCREGGLQEADAGALDFGHDRGVHWRWDA